MRQRLSQYKNVFLQIQPYRLMTANKNSTEFTDFPEETERKIHVRKCNEVSSNNQVVLHYQFPYSSDSLEKSKNEQMVAQAVHNFSKRDKGLQERSTAEICDRETAISPISYELFPYSFHVPFPNPPVGGRTIIDLFAGIGGIRLPFHEMGYRCVFSSEWDSHAQQTYLANFGEVPFGDITLAETKKHIPKHFDVLLAGFPCQAFSIMGKMQGFEDIRGTMFFEVATILEQHAPKALLLENVKQLTTLDHGKTFATILHTLGELGYYVKWKVLNALDFGLPQKRERVIIVGFRSLRQCEAFQFDFEKKPYNLKDILEDESQVEPSLLASDTIFQKRQVQIKGKDIFYPSIWHENKSGNVSVLDYACALRTGASYNYLLVNGRRRPSSRELLRLQGFPDNFRIVVTHGEIRRQTGNSVAIPMIRAVARKMDFILNNIQEL